MLALHSRFASRLTLVLCLTVVGGCATGSRTHDEQNPAYQHALQRGVQAHVYAMSCQAVLPVARDVLLDEGYDILLYDGARGHIETSWKFHDGELRSRQLVHAVTLGEQRCNVQMTVYDATDLEEQTARNAVLEFELLRRLYPEQAELLRRRAREAARRGLEAR